MTGRFQILPVLGVIALGLVLRLALAPYESEVGIDPVHYIEMGNNIASGHSFDTWDTTGGRWMLPPTFPLLIALFRLLGAGLEWSGHLAAMAAGAFLLFPLYLFTKRLYGHATAMAAVWIGAFMPIMVDYSVVIMAECLFAGFVILMMLSAHRAFSTGGKTRDAFLSGIWIGLAFLTKTLGILFLPFLILGFLFGRTGHSRTGAIKQATVALLGFLILAAPYWIVLRQTVGRWVIDGKGIGQQNRILAQDLGEEHVDPRYSGTLTADGSDFLINSKQPPNVQEIPLSKFIGVSVRKYVQKLVRIYQDYPFTPTYPNKVLILYLFPAMLLGLGLFIGRGTWKEHESDRFLLYWMCPWIFALPLIFIEVRYYIPMAPMAVPFMALGAGEVGRWVDRRFYGREKHNPSARAMMVVIAIFILLAAPKLTYKITHWKDPQLSYNPRKIAAEWLLDNGYHPTRVMEYGHSVSFYSRAQSILIPSGTIEDVIRIAGKYHVDLISLDEFYLRQGNRRPQLDYLLDSSKPAPPELNRIYVDERYPGLHEYIYRIRTPEEISALQRLNAESR